jgi:hypothetical protein
LYNEVLEKIMTLDEVKNHFGSFYKVLKKLDMKQQNATIWKRQGYIPLLQQYRIAELTDGELMPDDVDPKLNARQVKNGFDAKNGIKN